MTDTIEGTAHDSGPSIREARLVGKLTGMRNSKRGFAWLTLGPGLPDYFIHKSQVPPEQWRAGNRFEFTAIPAKPGTRAPQAGNPVLVAAAEHAQ